MNGTVELRENEWSSRVSDVRVSYSEVVSEESAALAAFTRRYRDRGFLRAAKEHEKDMDAMEEEAKIIAPAHYRWDEVCADGRGDRFRGATYLGRRVMDVDGFAAYFAECRASRRAAESENIVAEPQPTIAPARTREQSRAARLTNTSVTTNDTCHNPENMSDRAIAFAKDWLRPDDPALRRHGAKRPIPVTVISALVVLAVSLMLIVSSSVMVANARRDLGELDSEVRGLEKQAQLAADKLESHIDYLEIYRKATEEFGMIPASYVDSMYVNTSEGNTIEVVESNEEQVSGLFTLLSAIGINIGS